VCVPVCVLLTLSLSVKFFVTF